MSVHQTEASNVKVGDFIEMEDGSFERVAKIQTAKWIKTAEGSCLEFFARRNDRTGFLIGRGDIVGIKVP